MGLIAKARTASRTAAKTVPNMLAPDDIDDQLRATDDLIRSVACAVGSVSRSSTTLRGHTSSLVTLFGVGDVDSDLWFERLKPSEWQVALGAASSVGTTLDWAVQFVAVVQGGSPAISMATPQALTSDGALEKGAVHDSLRAAVTDAATTGVPADRSAVLEVTTAGYATPTNPPREPVPAQFTDAFTITAEYGLQDARDRIALSSGRRELTTPDRWRVDLGITGQPCAHAQLTLLDDPAGSRLEASVSFTASGIAIADAVAHHTATAFAHSLLATMQLFDGQAQLARPDAAEGDPRG